jgi:predicted DNA-binding protein (MmcQ/YjbR family)
MVKARSPLPKLRAHALSLPEAWEDFPWDDRVVKVRKKIFVMLGDASCGVKLSESHAAARTMPGVEPMRYGLGAHGWVRVAYADGPPAEILIEWIDESYALIAPKKLAAQVAVH